MISQPDITAAHDRIRPFIHRTPVLTSQTINLLTGATVFFKCENLQKTGSFKARGALNAVLQVAERDKPQSIATHSSGNHGQAVAFAAKKFGIPAYIVMPRTAPQVKKDAIRSYGAQVIECEPNLKAREEGVAAVIQNKGSYEIHPFDNDRVIAGQATAAKELIEDIDQPLDAIIAPVGGGGLLSGLSLAAHYLSASTLVYGAEPEGAADAILSFRSGKVEKVPAPASIADGILASLSDRTLTYIRAHATDIFVASEPEIIQAMKLVWERMKIVIEPSSAVALAVLLNNKAAFTGKTAFVGKTVGLVITGGNVDLTCLPF